jgi:glutamate racemase
MKLGVFDSGIGGLTVVKSLLKHHHFEEIIYYGDTARVPYGVKDENTIIRYAIDAVEFFKNFEIDLLIVACNTVSAYALDAMREVAPFKVLGVVEPGILAATKAKHDKSDPLLILATKATIASKAYETPLLEDDYSNITAIATGLFVPIVEENLINTEILTSAFNHYFKEIPTPRTIILGCTHFPLIADQLSHYFKGKSTLIHSGEAIVEYLETHYDFKKTFTEPKLKFFASENPDALKAIAYKWLDISA